MGKSQMCNSCPQKNLGIQIFKFKYIIWYMKAAWPPASPHWDQLSRVFQENWTKQGAMSQNFDASYLLA